MFTVLAANPWMAIPLVLLGLLFLALRWYYLKSSREIRRLESIARSPLYSHISATLQGLTTIRSCRKKQYAMNLFHNYHNAHSQGWYLSIISKSWFGLRMDVLILIYVTVTFFTSISVSSYVSAALVALSLTTASTNLFDLFQFSIKLSTDVENTMVSTERIMEYSKLESEASFDTIPPFDKPCPEWPENGEISLDDVCFRYSPHSPFVLESLTLKINPSEKIGIVGRTGAGKSSLVSVLFRMAEPIGHIEIDGIDILKIGLHDLRKKISIIPQDPVLFSGTVRYNIDPFCEHTDTEIWDVMDQVQLKHVVCNLKGEMYGIISEGGSNFSVGQRQLMCLARALLQRNKILILDEATANVDNDTDSIIQTAIRHHFVDCTVLTIAHRLNTIIDYDRILVLDGGHVMEFDSPQSLLQKPHSLFSSMVEQTGVKSSIVLRQMAQERYVCMQL